MHVVLTLRRQRQEECEFKASLGEIASLTSVWATKHDPDSKNK
jgi:hypothetical protein